MKITGENNKKNTWFILEFYADDMETVRCQQHFWISDKGYYYTQFCYSDGKSSKIKRVSEQYYINGLEEYYNA